MSKVLLVAVFALVAAAVGAGALYTRSMNEVAAIHIQDVDLEQLADGTYRGTCNTTLVSASVEVVVEDHRIQKVTILEHNCGRGGPAEAITETVVNQQSLAVDSVTGATVSSRVILKAIENALTAAAEPTAD